MSLNKFIYAVANLFNDKIDIPQRIPNRNKRSGRKMKLEGQIKKIRQQIQAKYTRIRRKKKDPQRHRIDNLTRIKKNSERRTYQKVPKLGQAMLTKQDVPKKKKKKRKKIIAQRQMNNQMHEKNWSKIWKLDDIIKMLSR